LVASVAFDAIGSYGPRPAITIASFGMPSLMHEHRDRVRARERQHPVVLVELLELARDRLVVRVPSTMMLCDA
jgi:hypothetical protein